MYSTCSGSLLAARKAEFPKLTCINYLPVVGLWRLALIDTEETAGKQEEVVARKLLAQKASWVLERRNHPDFTSISYLLTVDLLPLALI